MLHGEYFHPVSKIEETKGALLCGSCRTEQKVGRIYGGVRPWEIRRMLSRIISSMGSLRPFSTHCLYMAEHIRLEPAQQIVHGGIMQVKGLRLILARAASSWTVMCR